MMDNISKGPAFGVRHVQILLLFWMKFLIYSMRYNLSVAIVAMTENTSSNSDIPYFDWPNKSVVLSSFFWGYIIPQIPAGSLGLKYGTKKLLLICMVTNSFMTLLIPVAAVRSGAGGVIACRVVQGFAQGFFFPFTSSLQGKWVPVEERARIGAVIFSGATLGLVVTYPLTGFLCKSSLGWPSSYYLLGIMGTVWSVFYYFFGSDDPKSHKSITTEERFYIEESLGTLNSSEDLKTPWYAILTSAPMWTIFFTSLGHGWGSATVLSEMPTYFDKVLKLDISSNGMLSSLPYVGNFFTTFAMGFSSDYLINKGYLSRTNARKLFTAIGSFCPGILFLIFGFLPEGTNEYLVVAILVASVSIHSAVCSGYNINHYDLSPNFSGTLMGIINEGEELLSIITPLAVQFIVTDESDRDQWKIIITMGTIMYFVSAIVFGIFSTAEKQWWNAVPDEDDIKKTDEYVKKAARKFYF